MTNVPPLRPQDSSGQRDVYTHGYGSGMQQEMNSRYAGRDAAFFLPYLRPGMKLLDCGCGPGAITLGLAEVVAPGEVVGVDIEQSQVDLARARTAESGIANARFEVGSIYSLPFPDETFDAVFAHAVLEHLQEPIKALRGALRVLKPGGFLGVRSPDWGGSLIYPPDPMLEQFFDVYYKLMAHNGGSPNIGRRLRALLLEAGFVRVEGSASFAHLGNPEILRRMGSLFADRASDPAVIEQLVTQGWTDRETLQKMESALRSWGDMPGAFGGRPWCEAVG
jgi:ubiquinone/menaquinone biosynthesis C-methylase UbiE